MTRQWRAVPRSHFVIFRSDFYQFLYCAVRSHFSHNNATRLELISLRLSPSHFIKFVSNMHQFLSAYRIVTSLSNASDVAGYYCSVTPEAQRLFYGLATSYLRWVCLRIVLAEQHETDHVRLRSLRLHCLCGLMARWHKVEQFQHLFRWNNFRLTRNMSRT